MGLLFPDAEILSADLHALDPAALRKIANYLAKVAAQCRRRAQMLETRSKTLARKRAPFAEGLGELAADVGADEAARRYGVILSTAQLALRIHLKDKRALARRERDLQVMRLAGRGWSNSEIAQGTKLHPVTVSRIISRQLNRPVTPHRASSKAD
jgi:DNA-binding NarL/FixJ family response regulator